MPKQKLYLHIGIYKTGTTALQDFFLMNRDVLSEKGVVYPDIGMLNSSHNRFGASFYEDQDRTVAIQNLDNKSTKEYVEQIMDLSDDVLISTELIWHKGNDAYKLECLKNKFDIKVILYLRRQDLYLESAYNQEVKCNESRDIELFLGDIMESGLLDYDESTLSKWSRFAGKENLIVRPYEKEQFYGGSIFSDFLYYALNINSIEGFQLPSDYPNPRFSNNALEFKRLINQQDLVDYSLKEKLIPYLLDFSVKEDPDSYHPFAGQGLLSIGKRHEIIQKYARSNHQIACYYLGRQDGRLFYSPVSTPLTQKTYLGELTSNKTNEIAELLAKEDPEVFLEVTLQLLGALCSDVSLSKDTRWLLSLPTVAIEMASSLMEAKVGIAEKELTIQMLNETVSKKDDVIAKKDQLLKAAKIAITEKDQTLTDANTVITENEDAITALEEAVSRKDILTVEKDRMIEGLKDANSQKETVIAEKEKALENANTDIANLQAAVAENEQALADANTIITEKGEAVMALEEAISQKDDMVAEKNRTIGDLRDTNAQQETVIAERDQALKKANTDIANLQSITAEKDYAIADKDRQIHSYRQELYSVYTSRSWRFTLPMRKVGTVIRRILTIPHRPWLRAKIKWVYFLMPALVRNSRLIDNLKNRFKNKEIL